ncbi:MULTISPECIES: nucleotidyltransferase domain-containing protein [Virgibacillus]|uniref:Aminoglycoside-2''-adenylyltransferase n=2 Tax=Virgibacillus TaxID=84406 RepID=A0A024QCJ8_9BACI|nr:MULTISPECIES: hypothetical protein [Virgibacillus]EQB36230.1 hypothetical protein M948_14440 [Virgibacillus sp. CM-4]GGJ45543.1 hypothetical protein GCM10007111_04480 [Virgibacillus kapii]CDQ39930.1 hypothetical protein BN990_02247 [Virgibacillus massiliensis]
MPFEQCKHIKTVMSGFSKNWFFVGGWAIDLFLGKETRVHHDIEIGIFREDQIELKHFLSSWEFKKVVHREFIPWYNEYLVLPVHEIHAINKMDKHELEILLNESDTVNWRFRRDLRILYPLKSVLKYSETGLPYLAPEIVLLYKVRNTREKDHIDFLSVKDILHAKQKYWLREAIEMHEPKHEWLQLLG